MTPRSVARRAADVWRTTRTPLSEAFAHRRPWPGTRRGLKLWLIAWIVALKGAGYAAGTSTASTESALRLITADWGIPLVAVGWFIIVLCAVAGWCSFCHHGRDQWGYGLLVGFCWSYAACFAVSPLLLDGPASAWQGALSWFTIGLFLLVCATDLDPRVRMALQPGEARRRWWWRP